MPVESSIYWNSFDSQKITSGGSSNNNSDRHYVDPWDLENYAYLKRYSINVPTQRYQQERRTSYQSEYWYSQSLKEAQYSIPSLTEKFYCDPSCRMENNAYHYHRHPIYEDEVTNCVPSYSLYTPISALASCEMMENYSISDYDYRSLDDNSYKSRTNTNSRYTQNYSRQYMPNDSVRHLEKLQYNVEEYYAGMSPVEDNYMTHMVTPLNLDLNTYGHLKIDYTDSWNSLKRKISK
ncbi:PREDICTED: uncharacterized protein LOC107069249 [Polistes dominula]|uniref:Uncharacterized protein LOC107069249 n=1 Tax=Polistes dominula TaxID=743375 RepID=A0ABM1INV5_POLDO|nr:PREDICTED: uncharacterized protein LOC107069249 [Polistes dominula]XP_015181893.1 PREDICTED: uncharacterized protein LOC107069249 [Polistes dominula]